MMVSNSSDPNFIPNFPIINDDDSQEPVDPPPDRTERNSVPPLPDFSHPDAPGPSRENVPLFDDAIPDPTTESQSSNASYIPNEPSLPQETLFLSTAAPAEPQHTSPESANLPIEPQQSSSSSNAAPTEPQEVQNDDPSEPEQDDPANDDPFDPQASEPEASSSRSQSSHPSDPS
uniref:Uncharacterized protein n=1 Tax=Panagrolaimus sp. ES5 TaxID=591445 RepID=A0AC34G0H7_9BILA